MYLKITRVPPFPSYNVQEFIESDGAAEITLDYKYTMTKGKHKGTLASIPKEEVIDQIIELSRDPLQTILKAAPIKSIDHDAIQDKLSSELINQSGTIINYAKQKAGWEGIY